MKRFQTTNYIYDLESKVESFHWWFVVRRKLLKIIISSFDFKSNPVTLDIGCGTGSNLKTLKDLGLKVIGIDQSNYALSIIKRKSNFPLICGDINQLPIRSDSVGTIIAMDILEHLEDDSNGIGEIYRVLEKNGTIILTVPAFGFLWGIQDVITGHKRRYKKKEIIKKLEEEGFKVIRSSYFNFFLFFPIFFARRLVHIFGFNIKSENEINSPIINFFLKGIFLLETYILKYFPFPFGVSVFYVGKK